MQDDFDIPFSGAEGSRNLKDGHYVVEIIEVKRSTVKSKNSKYNGAPTLEWKMKIVEGEFNALNFIATTFLGPEEMAWTTDRIIAAVFPAVQKGQKVTPLDMIGKKLEMQIKTRMNEAKNTVSMYVNIEKVFPHAELGVGGEIGDFGADDAPSL